VALLLVVHLPQIIKVFYLSYGHFTFQTYSIQESQFPFMSFYNIEVKMSWFIFFFLLLLLLPVFFKYVKVVLISVIYDTKLNISK